MTIVSGPIAQICWVVPDIADAERYHADAFGVGPWVRLDDIHFAPDDVTYRGAPADFTIHVSLADRGDLELELIQPVTGESIYAEFLASNPAGGLHHVAFEVDDVDDALDRAGDVPVAQRGVMAGGLMSFAYLDGSAYGAPYVELLHYTDEMREMLASMKAKAVQADNT